MNPWELRGDQPSTTENFTQQQQQYISQEQFKQYQQQQQREHQNQLQQQHQQMLEHQQTLLQQQNRQQNTQSSTSFEAALTMIAESQRMLAKNMSRLMIKLETQTPQMTSEVPKKHPARQNPPHLNSNTPIDRTSYAPSSPSEGVYARDPSKWFLIHKEPPIRENLRFTGESRLLRQFLIDIYDTLERYSNEFENNKRRINWIAAHFVSQTANDVSPAQAWFLALLMKNAHAHGVIDPYANLKSLEYVLPTLSSTEEFIKELISTFGDKATSRTAREDLLKCKQLNGSIIDYNSKYTALALYVVQSDEDAILKYVAGLNPETRYAAIHVPGWVDAKTVADKMAIAVQGQRIVDEVAAMGGKNKRQNVYQHPNAHNSTHPPVPVQIVKPSLPSPTHSAMEIDAVGTRQDKKNPFPAIRSVCIRNGLCF